MAIDLEAIQFIPRSPSVSARKVLVILDSPTEVETRSQLAFSAPSAKELSMHLHKAGLGRDVVHMTYLFNFRIPKGDPKDLFHTAGLAVTDYHSWEQSKKESLLNFAHNTLKNLRDEIHSVSPDLIICTGRWGLYFLSGETSVLETAKSPYGTLIKWRASKLKLGSFWNYDKPHILIPILPPSAKHQLPEKKKIIEHDLSKRIQYLGRKIKEGTFVEDCVEERYSFTTRPDFDTVMTWLHQDLESLDNAEAGVEFAIDVETCNGFHNCISIARDSFNSICIPWCTLDNPYYWTETQEFEIVKMLKKIFLHKNFRSIGQNFWYDMQYIERDLGILIKSDVDTMVMQTVLFTALEKSLDFLASLYCQHYKYWKGDGIGTAGRGKTDIQNWIRNCKDTCFTFEAAQVMKQILAHSDPKLQRAYKNQIERVVPMVHAMNRRGVRQDAGQKAKLKAEFTIVKEQAQKELDYILGERLNINSPAQIQTLLYDIYKLPVQLDPKTKRPSAGHEALELLGGIEPLCRPIVRRISELSQISKLLSTYLEAKPDIDGRMRTGYGWTDSFRFTSSKDAFHTGMNRQNIPKASETMRGRSLPNLRKLDIPDAGMEMFDIDLDSADLRIVAVESGAKAVQAMFDAGAKPYIEMMKQFYHDPKKNKYSKEYKTFKSICHALNYCGSAAGIAARVGMLVHDVEIISKFWFSANPEIKTNYHERLRREIFGRGYIENSFGFRRPFWNLSEPNIMQIAAPWIPSSTVSHITIEGMCRIHENFPELELLLNVHDSAVIQAPIGRTGEFKDIIRGCFTMELNYPNKMIIPVDVVSSTKSWGEMD
jgi:DNA polymerase I-like protein with 3'-5' exonuclease and polymerase domains